MNVLVTGGAGYIGSHAVRELLQEGFKPIVLDDLSNGHASSVPANVPLYEGSIFDHKLLSGIFVEHSIDAVMNFAAYIEVGESVREPGKYYRNNFSGVVELLTAMRDSGVDKIIFSSTAAVYGDPVRVPIDETHPMRPINPYGRSKMMAEMAIEDHSKAHGLGYTILRYFNVAGASPDGTIGEAHDPETHLIPRILKSALGSNPSVEIYGTDYPTSDGTCIRDYVHVVDLARAHVLALKSTVPGRGRVYNLGSENGFTVRQVIDSCQRVARKKLNVVEHDRRSGDPSVLIASSAKIREELGWTRLYPELEEIIEHAWKWHETHPRGFEGSSYARSGLRYADSVAPDRGP